MSTVWLTTQEVADMLRMNVQEVRRFIRRGDITAKKLGKTFRVTPAAVNAFMDGLEDAA